MTVRDWKRIAKWAVALLGIAFIAIQFVPVDRSNPPVETEFAVPAEVRTILRRACYDCHSNETVWPWYSRVAPISWLVASDVQEGRDEMNFSTWNRWSAKKRNRAARKIWEQVKNEEMPLWFYIPLHAESRLTVEDRAMLQAWSLAVSNDEHNRPEERAE
ncbi:MAG: heme-binding domain-containing protein [Acidobacteriota bacterium]